MPAEIRPFAPEDLSAVAALLRAHLGLPVPDVERFLAATLLEDPWADPEMPSLVAERDGAVVGFIARQPRRLELDGAPLAAACCSHLTVAPEERAGALAARLARACLAGPQRLTYSDAASDLVVRLWRVLGGDVDGARACDWMLLLRPARWAASLARGRTLGPVAAAPLHALGRGTRRRLRGAAPAGRAEVRVQPLERGLGALRVARVALAQRHLLEQVVAPEQLVRALARGHHGDAGLARPPGQQHQRDRGGADQRRLAVPDRVSERRGDVGRRHLQHVVLGAERGGGALLVRALVVARVGEGDRERVQRVVRGPLRERRDQRGVQPAGQVGPDRDVGAQPQPHAVGQHLAEPGARGVVLRAPPAREAHNAPALPHQERPRRQLRDAGEARARRARRPQRERLIQPVEVGRRLDLARGEQRLGLRAEHECPRPLGVVQRAHAEAVAGEQQAPPRGLPVRQREVAVEAAQRRRALLLEQPQHDLGVGGRLEPRAQRSPQLDVVEDLAVERQQRSARAGHRLPAAGDVDDRQPRGHQPGAGVERQPEPVRAAMAQRAGHPQQRRLVHRRLRVGAHDPAQPAHQGSITMAGACR
jgi:hypothetical protein